MAQIATLDKQAEFFAYVAAPEGDARAAIIVIPEIFGVNRGIRQKCDRLAEAGYLAVAPEIFWRFAPGLELDPDVPEEMQRALDLFGQFDPDAGIKDIEATIHAIRAGVDGHPPIKMVGCVGYCLGGKMAYMVATRTDIDASVGYYGVTIDQMLGESHMIARPLMLHIAGDDGFVSKEAQAKMHAGLDDHPRVTLHDYPGMNHGFATELGERRNDEAAKLADERTMAFFAEHLG